MKKSYVILALLIAAISFSTVTGYVESNTPKKHQAELFVGSVEFP